mmetsp:Transcript_74620/g.129481  ORF Transcript_74620/g.129481 Transcript_74620/m.129481 type:complete len:125 (-) Transcript_74620:45-419(-)
MTVTLTMITLSEPLQLSGSWHITEIRRGSFIYEFEVDSDGAITGRGRAKHHGASSWRITLRGKLLERHLMWTEYAYGTTDSESLGEFHSTLEFDDKGLTFSGTGLLTGGGKLEYTARKTEENES